MRVLEAAGYVRRSASAEGYFLGVRLLELGEAAAEALDVPALLHGTLSALSHRFNATAHLGVYRSGMITIIEKIDPPHPLVQFDTRHPNAAARYSERQSRARAHA